MTFIRTVRAPESFSDKAFVLMFDEAGHLLVEKNQEDRIRFPLLHQDDVDSFPLRDITFLGSCGPTPCYCAGWHGCDPPDRFEWLNLRKLLPKVDSDFWEVAGYARQINDCNVNSAYCGKCGNRTIPKTDEQGRFCETCNLTYYPRISPAVIMAVVKKDKLLLARGVNFPNKKMFSVLAGFVDPQERLEDCVKREVFEETGIKVKNVRYFDSQPWPFPDSLMIGFTAEYDSGTISIDPGEIAEAGWFPADHMPLVPGKPTLSGELIRWFVRRQGQ